MYRVAYLPGRQSQRSGDRLSAYVAFGWRGELMCSHRLAVVLDDLRSAVRMVLVNSSRAWSSSGGVVVIERQVEVLRTIAGLAAAPRPEPVGPEPAIDGIAGGAGGGHAGGRCRSCGLRSADLLALGWVRLLCRQAIGGG